MVSQTNLPMTGYQQFLAELYEELPVINPIAYLDKDGKVYEDESDLPEELQAKLLQYSYLSYYNLFQRWEEAYSFFYLPEAS
jgi:hypothetical protein